jgi:hypothetical protein
MYEVERIIIEVFSAIACFILVKFMVKPFLLTRENRYLCLPLGFGFLGVSYAFSALSFSPMFDFTNIGWIQLFFRAFAFLFLAVTYYFSKQVKDPKLRWNATLVALTVILTTLVILVIISPPYSYADYLLATVCLRTFNVICLSYISIHALKSHIEKPDPTTLSIPFGYIFLGIGQYLVLIWVLDGSTMAFWTALALRLVGLSVFLFVCFRAFYSQKERKR